ncbi:copia protein [Lasius niger]|uniref:Copia protein n=1 Tax=Lasius niger TaxID=67767 RepID=A0A0J7KEL8_LASNI|nr:copia protein [Lasius niger]
MKMNEGEKLEGFLSKFDHVLCQLKSSGAEIKEEDAICTLLLALPKSYETVVTVLENMAVETLDMNYVKTRLRIDSEKRKENDGDQSEPMKTDAFISNKSIKCHNCGEIGHIKRYCKKPS